MRINAVIAEQMPALKGLADILGKLDTGDLIRAKVLEATTGELLLKLVDGTLLRAAAASDIDTAPGETLELMVKGRNGDTLVMETVRKNLPAVKSPDDDIAGFLDKIGVKPDEKAVSLAVEAKAAGFGISKELINNAARLLNAFKGVTPEKAVFLSSRNIDAGSQTIHNAIRLLEGSLQLGSQLEELDSMLSKLMDDSFMEENIINSKNIEVTKHEASSADTAGVKNEAHAANRHQSDNSGEFPIGSSEVKTGLSNNASVEGKALSEKLPEALYSNRAAKAPVSDGIEINGHDGFPDINMEGKSDSGLIVFQKPVEGRLNGTKGDLNEIRDKVKVIQKAIKDLFIPVEDKKLSSRLEIKELFKEVHDKLKAARELIETVNAPARAELSAKLQEIDDGMKLLHQFSSNNIYVQLPLNVNGYRATAELYIYKKDKGRKRIDPQNAVVCIALDTQNLGRIESVIDVKGKNVSINFRAENQKVINFLKESYKLLYSGLLEKGYRLADVKYRLIEARINPANAEKLAVKDLVSGHASVDLKI